MTHLMRASRNKRRRARALGQAATEFAMVVPLALTILFAIVEFGLIVHAYTFASNSARDAVRYAIVHGSTSSSPATSTDIQNFVWAEAAGIDTSKLTITTTPASNWTPGSPVKVQVTYAFQPLYPLSGVSLSLTGTAQMIVSQ
jgi:Flp pilus assembly protein TadG